MAKPLPNNYRRQGTPGRPPRQVVYERLAIQIQEVKDRLGGLPTPVEASGIWRDIWLEEAHHSTAIEGNTLVQKQVQKLLEEGRAVGDKELREYMEVQGYANAAEWVYGRAIEPGSWTSDALITLTDLRHVHKLTMDLVWDVAPHPQATDNERPGSFRQHDIEPFPGGMQPPSWPEVPSQIATWIAETGQLSEREPVEVPEALAALHAQFERVHPFLDGNGRTGRLVLNLLLVRLGYPPAIIYKRERSHYLRALRRADQGDCGALGEVLARAVLDNLYRFVVPAIAGPARLVPLPALATKKISADALRVAAARGRLEATKGADGTWRSSRLWVNQYLSGRARRRKRKEPSDQAPEDSREPPTVSNSPIEPIPRADVAGAGE
jgi:fido (protein-threonine AMPylation protein)